MRRDLADETADLLGHLLLFAHRNDIDLAAAIERKWLFKPAEVLKG
jgi:NTP pyrophosphatase (non-canonical NTP hydrolase)